MAGELWWTYSCFVDEYKNKDGDKDSELRI